MYPLTPDGDNISFTPAEQPNANGITPCACSLFGISNDVAMQVVGVGFIIGVIQDSVETALNSAGDVEFAATAEYHQWLKQGKPLPEFLGGKKK